MVDLTRARELVRELKQPLETAQDQHPRSALLKGMLFLAEGLAYSLHRAQQGKRRHLVVAAWWIGKIHERAGGMNPRQQPEAVAQAVGPWALHSEELLNLVADAVPQSTPI